MNTLTPSTGRLLTASVTVPRTVPVPCAAITDAQHSSRPALQYRAVLKRRRGGRISTSLCGGYTSATTNDLMQRSILADQSQRCRTGMIRATGDGGEPSRVE